MNIFFNKLYLANTYDYYKLSHTNYFKEFIKLCSMKDHEFYVYPYYV